MAAKSNTEVVSSREQLIAMLLNGSNEQAAPKRTVSEFLRDTATDAASTSLNTAGAIAGALKGAYGNAVQTFTLEANFREQERKVNAMRTAMRYADRLEKLHG
jgi:hypothetical protein